MVRASRSLALALLAAAVVAAARPARSDTFPIALFEQYAESLRRAAGIPGLSAAIVQNGQIVWERGFGFQDVENVVRARPDTPYAIGGITQTMAATLLLRCVERGRLDLDARIGAFTSRIANPDARVRHVLTHTSDGVPGERFKYDLSRIRALTEVSNACTGFGFRKMLVWDVLQYLAMTDSVPGADVVNPDVFPPETFDPPVQERFARTLERLAVPYTVNRKGEPSRAEFTSRGIDTATGVISTVRDLALYDRALADGSLLAPETLSVAWTNPQSASGGPLPHALGWFVQMVDGVKVVWQFGLVEDGYSSLIVRVPSRAVTMIVLANSDGLSAPYQLSAGDVTVSPFAKVFLRLFL